MRTSSGGSFDDDAHRSDPAVDDLQSIYDYIALDSQTYADAVVLELLEAAERLRVFPNAGRIVPELADDQTRELIIGSCRLIYETAVQAVIVHAVIHGARDFPAVFGEES
ncbi:MAG: type II toxin-antitoxin system RelE/ParE family toxin [Planctomycetes bacterium]|nr:type II toxin-antitoxin system RelE/ParE family toxin [Planctomycetota bacterium]